MFHYIFLRLDFILDKTYARQGRTNDPIQLYGVCISQTVDNVFIWVLFFREKYMSVLNHF